VKIKVNGTEIELLKKHSFDCSCGKKHQMNIDEVIVGSNLLEKIPEIVKNHDMGNKVFVVMDHMIYELYGEKIENSLKNA